LSIVGRKTSAITQEHYSERESSSDSEVNACADSHVSDAQNVNEAPLPAPVDGEGETGQSSNLSQVEGCDCAAAHVRALLLSVM